MQHCATGIYSTALLVCAARPTGVLQMMLNEATLCLAWLTNPSLLAERSRRRESTIAQLLASLPSWDQLDKILETRTREAVASVTDLSRKMRVLRLRVNRCQGCVCGSSQQQAPQQTEGLFL